MSTKYWNALRRSYYNDVDLPPEENSMYESTEWSSRVHRCAKHLISAVSFRETSKSASTMTGSSLLPVIGYYYAMFHMGVAVLYIDYATDRSDLEMIKHSKLWNLIDSKLVVRSLISSDFSDLLYKLKIMREFTNYEFNEYFDWTDGTLFMAKYDVDAIYDETGKSFEICFKFLERASDEIGNKNLSDPILKHRIAGLISDTLFDDLAAAYLSKKDEEKVSDYLLSVGFSH